MRCSEEQEYKTGQRKEESMFLAYGYCGESLNLCCGQITKPLLGTAVPSSSHFLIQVCVSETHFTMITILIISPTTGGSSPANKRN